MAVTLGDAVLYITGSNKGLKDSLSQSEGMVKSWGGSVSGFFSNTFAQALGGTIERAIQGIGQAILSIPQAAYQAIASNELLTQSFTALVASQMRLNDASLSQADAIAAAIPFAQELLNWNRQLAINSPFDEQGVAKAMRTGMAYGFTTEEAKRLTKAVIDMATATGQGTQTMNRIEEVLGRVRASGRVLLGDLNYLADAGVNVDLVLRKMGISMQDIEKGTVRADQFIEGVTSTLEDQFGGAAERAAGTWNGLMNSLGDIVSINLREFFDGAFSALQPLAQTLVDVFGSGAVSASLREIGTTIGQLITPAVQYLIEQLKQLPAALQNVNNFIVQMKDEFAGLSAQDILGGIPAGVAQIQTQLGTTLDVLSKQHTGAVQNMKDQITQKGTELGEEMTKIAEEYGPKIAEVNERYTKAIAEINDRMAKTTEAHNEKMAEMADQLAQRLGDMDEQHAKAQKKANEQLAENTRQTEERVTEIKADHRRKRMQLMMSLLTAESEEQWLNIKAQLDAEDTKAKEDVNKTKDAGQKKKDEIKAQMAEQDAEYEKQRKRTEQEGEKARKKAQKQYDEQMTDLKENLAEQQKEWGKALSKINAERAKAEQAAKDKYDQEVAALQNKIDMENKSYAEQVEATKKAAKEQTDAFIAEQQRRAAAIGEGPAHDLVIQIKAWMETFNQLKTTVMDFVNNHAVALTGVLIGLGVVLGGGLIVSALTAIAGALAGISLPIVAIVAGVALLYTAWTENWGGIQEKTAAVVEWMKLNLLPLWDQLVAGAREFWTFLVGLWTQYGPQVIALLGAWWAATMAFWTMVFSWISTTVSGWLTQIQAFWQAHGDWIKTIVELLWENIKLIFSGALQILTDLFTLFTAAREGDWRKFGETLRHIWDTAWKTITGIFDNAKKALTETVTELIETISNLFTGKDWASIGQSIIDGIAGAISGGGETLANAATGAASAVEEAMKGFFQSDSPSKLMRKDPALGPSIPQGLALGITDEIPAMQRSIQAALNLATGQLRPAVQGALSPNVQLAQTNNFPPRAGGWDEESLLNKTAEQTKQLLLRSYDDQ